MYAVWNVTVQVEYLTTLKKNYNTFGIRTRHKKQVIRMKEKAHRVFNVQKDVKYNLFLHRTAVQRNKYISALKRVQWKLYFDGSQFLDSKKKKKLTYLDNV